MISSSQDQITKPIITSLIASYSPCTSSINLLPNPDKKTLLLGVRKTIIHASRNPPPDGQYDFKVDWVEKKKTRVLYVILRPGLREFLQAAKKASFEIVPFTMWPRSLMSDILDWIDPSGLIISHWMMRSSHSDMLKGRLLDRTVMVDHKPKIYGKPWSNAIKVSLFSGNANDVELWSLHSFFEAQRNATDLRDLIHVSSGDPPLPGLPLSDTTHKTLFLDLDETLIYHVRLHAKPPDRFDFTTKDCYVIKRPGVDRLLQAAVDCAYEIVIFTAGSREYASPIIDELDPMRLITHRLYKDSCKQDSQGKSVKDLASTGRSLGRCVIFDDKIYRVLQRENVVIVKPFTGDKQDSEIERLLLFFQIENSYEDLRAAAGRVNESFVLN